MSEPSVIVGMSGGVDSSVAALLLVEEGYSVRGLFMKNWDEDDGTEYCTAQADLEDAARACARLGIELATANFAAEYWDDVFTHFLAGYRANRTPNPDVLCNREIKFKQFSDYASALGADAIATGHYVRGTKDGENYALMKGVDGQKDQSYFLQAVPAEKLTACLFPLGTMTKTEVRERARTAGLHNHRKKDSTGICFIGERRFADFLGRYVHAESGPITDPSGRTLGEHRGLPYYTIGQRQGLGIGGVAGRPERPWYVAEKLPQSNTLVVSQNAADLAYDHLWTRDVNWLVDPPVLPFACWAKIRYRQSDQACTLYPRADGAIGVRFAEAQRAVAPGQFVAFYAGDRCLGGGEILGGHRAGCA